jgi:uncharacterized membrane protein YuzA (DUF378 family)
MVAVARPDLATLGMREATEQEVSMQYLKALALLLVIVGGVNWLLVGVAKFDLVAAITGTSFGETNAISAVIYILVGLGAVALVPTLLRWVTTSDSAA